MLPPERGEDRHPLECTVWVWGSAFPLHHLPGWAQFGFSWWVDLEVWTEVAEEMVLGMLLSLSFQPACPKVQGTIPWPLHTTSPVTKGTSGLCPSFPFLSCPCDSLSSSPSRGKALPQHEELQVLGPCWIWSHPAPPVPSPVPRGLLSSLLILRRPLHLCTDTRKQFHWNVSSLSHQRAFSMPLIPLPNRKNFHSFHLPERQFFWGVCLQLCCPNTSLPPHISLIVDKHENPFPS